MKTKLSLILASLAMAFSVGAGVAATSKNVQEAEAAQHAENFSNFTYSGNYYSDAFSSYTEGLNGSLRQNLTSLIHPTSVPEYSSGLATHLQQADEDPTNSANMIYLYTRDSVKKNSASSWNREHVWPKNLSNSCWTESKAGADMLHLRPTYSTPNSTRSNLKYGDVTKNNSTIRNYNDMDYGYLSGNYFMPLDAAKGDVARICMYIWVAYYEEYGNKLPSLTNVFQSFDVMMTWHINDKPDVLEGHRNDYVEGHVQFNRNPFVDHPEYAWKIFGSQCSENVLNAAKAAYPAEGSGGGGSSLDGNYSIVTSNTSLSNGDEVVLTTLQSSGSIEGITGWNGTNDATASTTESDWVTYTVSNASNSGFNLKDNTANKYIAAPDGNNFKYSDNAGTIGVESDGKFVSNSRYLCKNNTYYRCYTSTTGYTPFYVYKVNPQKTVQSIAVKTPPTKTSYSAGEYFNPAGLVITVTYGANDTEDVSYSSQSSAFSFTPSTSTALTTSNTSVTIGYGGQTTSQAISVAQASTTFYIDGSNYTDYSYTGCTTQGLGGGATNNFTSETTVIMNASGNGYLYNTNAFATNIKAFSIYSNKGSSTSAAVNVFFGSGSNPSTNQRSVSLSTDDTVYPISNAPSNCKYFKIVTTSSKKAQIQLKIELESSSGSKTLTSISISSNPTKTEYTAGEYFAPSGLIINRNFSDSTKDTYTYAGHTSEFTFTPDLETALTASDEAVTVSYGGQTTQVSIVVTNPMPTSISASLKTPKTFYPGETIIKSDISVITNTNVDVTESITFADYQFTYEDSGVSGNSKNKVFNISYESLDTTLTVQVARKAYVAPSNVKDELTADDFTATTTSYTNFSGVTKTSSAVYAGNTAKDNSGNIQLRSSNNCGIVSTTSGGSIQSVKINVASGNKVIDVYGYNSAYESAADLYGTPKGTKVGSVSGTGTISFSTSYAYVGIRANNGAVYISSIEITYGNYQTAKNVSNYIMYEDTNNQCNSKLTVAIGYLNDLTQDELDLFASKTEVQDYVIYTARTRLNAWATSKGKTIDYSTAGHVQMNSNQLSPISSIFEGGNATTIIIVIGVVALSALGGYVFIRKRKES